jgi:hypothetical protein
MALLTLTTDQKDQLKQATKFAALMRAGAYTKANFWINTVDPGNVSTLPGGVGNTATYERWRKSKTFSTQIFQNPAMPEANDSLKNLFLSSLTAPVNDTGGVYYFTTSLANANIGATFTNNGQTFTVQATIAPNTILSCTGTGAPTASGTLTKASGTGDATIAFSAVTAISPVISFDPNIVILNMETYASIMIDPAMDAAFDLIIKYNP